MNIYRHGELILKSVDNLPDGAELVEETKKKIVAHSETGHHHVLESKNPFKVFTSGEDTYITMTEMADLWHQKTGKDAHKTHTIAPSIYKVVIKKQFDYFLKKMSQVRD